MSNRLIVSLWILIACVAITGQMFGQSGNGTLAGDVKDSQGALIPRAAIVAKNNATGVMSKTVSSSEGHYRIPELQTGIYTVSVSITGFLTSVAVHVILEANSTTSLPIVLKPGAVTETVTVDTESAQVQTESSEVSTTVTPELTNNFPINSGTGIRSATAVLYVSPGVTGAGDLSYFKIAGGQVMSSDFQLDGATVNSVTGAAGGVASPSVEAVQEVSIIGVGMPAEYGRTTGGFLNMVSRSGTNEFHGVAYDILRNTALDANGWFSNHYKAEQCVGANDTAACRAGFAVPTDKKNDYGITIGGPVWIPKLYDGRNKMFFFYSFERDPVTNGGLVTSTVPTVANRNGDFTATLDETNVLLAQNPCDNNNPVYAGEIFDPSTTQIVGGVTCRSPFVSNGQLNIITAPISTVANNVLSYYPLPTTSGILNNYTYRFSLPAVSTLQTIRIDRDFSSGDKIFASYNSGIGSSQSGGQFPGAASYTLGGKSISRIYRLAYDHIFSSSLENHLNFGANRTSSLSGQANTDPSTNYPQALGISNLTTPGIFPYFYVGEGYDAAGPPQYDKQFQTVFDGGDALSWTKGKHSAKFGYNLRFFQLADAPHSLAAGEYIFQRAETAATSSLAAAAISGNSFASFYLGDLNIAAAQYLVHAPLWKSWYQAIYAEDDYKVTSSLMLNLGIRYSLDLPPRESANDSSILDLNTPNSGADGLPGALIFSGTGPGRSGRGSGWANLYFGDIAPRVGFSWSPSVFDRKTALRGSYGILYGQEPDATEYGDTQTGFTSTGYYSDSNSVGGFSGTGFNLDAAFPPISTTVNFSPTQVNGTATGVYAQKDAKPAMVQIWNLQLQQQLAPDLLFSIGYVGNHTTRLPSNLKYINSLPEQYWSLGAKLTENVAGNTYGIPTPYSSFYGTIANALRPYPQFLQINPVVETVGQSSYNALWVTLQRRFRNGLSLQAAYTYSKTVTDADYLDTQYFSTGAPQNPFDLKGEKSRSYQDTPHILTVDYVYQLPFGRNKAFLNRTSVENALVGGWQIGGALRYASSFPITFGCAGSIPGTDNCVRWNHSGGDFLSKAARSKHFNPDTDNYYLNPGQTVSQIFTNPNANVSDTVGYKLGNVGKYTNARGPFTSNEDMNLAKSFPLYKSVSARLRFEAFNIFNRHYFSPGDSGPNDPGFGTVTGASAPRQMQVFFQITY